MKCKMVQMVLLECDGSLSESERQHLKTCADCSAFEAACRQIRSVQPFSAPVLSYELQLQVKRAGLARISSNAAKSLSSVPLAVRAALLTAAAGSLTWAVGVVADVIRNGVMTLSGYGALLIAAQNLLALFLTPALVRRAHKHPESDRLAGTVETNDLGMQR